MKGSTLSFDSEPLTVVGTGFIPLDVVLDEAFPHVQRLYAGGTCGNVLTILASFGWKSYPVARLKSDSAAAYVRRDLKRWGVHLDLLSLRPTANTPLIVERVGYRSNGTPFHRFSWTCPSCGAWLPGYRSIIAKAIPDVTAKVPNASVYFFDRVSRASVELAKVYSKQGAWIVFEPSGASDPKLFQEALKYAHVLKYSNERLNELSELTGTNLPLLQIETLGQQGSRYRMPHMNKSADNWVSVAAFDVQHPVDTAGSGDWYTAGLLHNLCRLGRPSQVKLTRKLVLPIIKLGHALAAWNCGYAGARGGMYKEDRNAIAEHVNTLVSGDDPNIKTGTVRRQRRATQVACLSSTCESIFESVSDSVL